MEMMSAALLQRWQFATGIGSGATPREEVAMHFGACVTGVDLRTAQERTKAFYRSSGNDWTAALS
ncbi:MAG TPA: hypothetical protein VLW55_11415 [Burkholderiaceae bacterium]|nr:hypothetical protein [Burkholderiaceae bacterium]